MKNNFVQLTLILAGFISLFSSCNTKEITIKDLRCEYLTNPVVIESAQPLLSWGFQSNARKKSQTAYRILVAGNPELLQVNKANYWDSGIRKSDQSVHIQYEGKPLESGKQYYWKVMVWDEKDKPTAWSEVGTWSMGLLEKKDWTAKWIAEREDIYPDSTLTFPAPFFRKQFQVKEGIKRARAYVCGLGFYEFYLNGQKVGDQVLAPAVTNYDERVIQNILYYYDDQTTQRVLYNTFDVTDQLKPGDNTAGSVLGNGWYNQRDRTVEGCMWYSTPRLLLQLEIEYSDGTIQKVETDNSWKCTTGPLLHDAIFTGEIYDARLELGDWCLNGFRDNGWQQAIEVKAPTGKLHAQLAPYDEITRTIQPVFDGQKNDSVYLYALPEMISGWAELSVQGKAGDKIQLRFIGEENNDFGQIDTYILKGGEPERWEPRFTWHSFRYMEITSPDVRLDETSVLIKVVHTNPEKTGSFHCSNELFNKIHEAYILTQDINFHGSISSDCPHRERIAYTGDGQVVVESSIYSYDMSRFYRKWFNDMQDAQNKVSGYVPHTAPFAGGGGGPAWGSAYVIMPWAYYLFYGDKSILEDHYEGMKHWVEYLGTRTDERGIVVREEPDGWCLGDWCTPGRVLIPEPFVNTAYYYHCADLLIRIATTLNKKEDILYYRDLSQRIRNDFNAVYFNPETNSYREGIQGENVFPLAFGMVPDNREQQVFQSLLNHLEKINFHFDTGILATPLLINVLTDYDRIDIAYRVMDQRTEPGYGYLLDDANSCLWERWNGKASRCHPMFGSVVAWFYNSLAGIRTDSLHPGMKHIIIAPQPTDDLSFCKASYQSVHGTIRSEWENTADSFILKVDIPVNTTATVILPDTGKKEVLISGKNPGKTLLTRTNGESDTRRKEIGSGSYIFEVR